MQSHLDITDRKDGAVTIALLTGRLDALQVPVLNEWFEKQLEVGSGPLVFDFGGLEYLSSAGLRVLLAQSKELKKQQRQFVICGVFGLVREVFMVSGLVELFCIRNSVAEALADVS